MTVETVPGVMTLRTPRGVLRGVLFESVEAMRARGYGDYYFTWAGFKVYTRVVWFEGRGNAVLYGFVKE
jgi:hypothetical protein